MIIETGVFALTETATIPEKATEGSACFDLRCDFDLGDSIVAYNPSNVKEILYPKKRDDSFSPYLDIPSNYRVLVPTNLIFDMPPIYYLKLYPRSSVSIKRGLGLINSVGIIDNDYVDPIFIPMMNFSNREVTIITGERVAQGHFCVNPFSPMSQTFTRPEIKTNRKGGFGSTGQE